MCRVVSKVLVFSVMVLVVMCVVGRVVNSVVFVLLLIKIVLGVGRFFSVLGVWLWMVCIWVRLNVVILVWIWVMWLVCGLR